MLHLKKFLAIPVVVAPLVLGFGGVAFAGNPTEPPPALPSDQIVLNGSCVSVEQVVAAAEDAMALYVPGDQPAGVIVNGSWVPAAAAYYVAFNSSSGCVGLVAPTISPVAPTNNSLFPTDQIALSGSCLSVQQVMAAAREAIALYVPGDQPAGVTVNGGWVPAAAAYAVAFNSSTGCVTLG
jgi:hypothetical protein